MQTRKSKDVSPLDIPAWLRVENRVQLPKKRAAEVQKQLAAAAEAAKPLSFSRPTATPVADDLLVEPEWKRIRRENRDAAKRAAEREKKNRNNGKIYLPSLVMMVPMPPARQARILKELPTDGHRATFKRLVDGVRAPAAAIEGAAALPRGALGEAIGDEDGIVMLIKEYPRPPGTKRADHFAIAKRSKTVGAYVKAGGSRVELRWFVTWGWVKVGG